MSDDLMTETVTTDARLSPVDSPAAWSVAKATMVSQPERVQLARYLNDRGFRLD